MPQDQWENLASLASVGAGLLVGLALWARLIPATFLTRAERCFQSFAASKRRGGLLVTLCSLTAGAWVAFHRGLPHPLVHDEFSYLLAADTFAHGRITNPTPPFPEHFETPQQLMRPTYMSKYPPGQGVALAIGQIICGRPIVGAWVGTAAAVLAVYWMLLGFTSPTWALLGGLLAAFHPRLLDWGHSYWGGSVAVLGGAIVVGAWGRCMIRVSHAAVVLLIIGLFILANTRPFEGLVFSLPLVMGLMIQQRRRWLSLFTSAAVPLTAGALLMGYYNWRITGRWCRIPYLEYADQYEIYPKFWILPHRPVHVSLNPAMDFVHRIFEAQAYSSFESIKKAFASSQFRLNSLLATNLPLLILLLPLIGGTLLIRNTRLQLLRASILLLIAALWTEIFLFPHYQAPMVPAFILLLVAGLHKLYFWKWRAHLTGRVLVRAVAGGCLAGWAMTLMQPAYSDPDMLDRDAIVSRLPQLQTGRHLVLVSYSPMHSYHCELVHNAADINAAQVIWARNLDPASDRSLIMHYPDRTTWSLYVGGKCELKPWQDH